MLQPIQPQQQPKPEMSTPTPNMDTLPQQTPGAGDTSLQVLGDDGTPDDGGASIIQELEMHLDQLPDQDKAFLGEHLTPEFVRAIGLINGPEVAQYLNQFADPNKVLVPVPRQIAEEYLAQQSQGGSPAQPQGQPAPQGQPMPAPQSAPAAPPQGMMTPQM